MNKLIQSILRDLYDLDPEMKKLEKDLVPLLEKLVEAKPSLKLDQGFVKNLRQKLMGRADELMETERPTRINWFHRFFSPLMGGTVALAALMIGLMVWKGNEAVVQESQFIQTVAEPVAYEPSEPLVAKPEPAPTPAPAPKTETVAKPTQALEKTSDKSVPPASPVAEEPTATAPMMLQAVPTEGGARESTPPPAEKATFREMAASDDASAGSSDQTSILESALRRAQSGERKITANSAQIGFRSPQELISLNFDYLPDGFEEIKSILPAGYRAFVDTAGGTTEYYIYVQNAYQWYGPFWSEAE